MSALPAVEFLGIGPTLHAYTEIPLSLNVDRSTARFNRNLLEAPTYT